MRWIGEAKSTLLPWKEKFKLAISRPKWNEKMVP
jgi:hypothetical protein